MAKNKFTTVSFSFFSFFILSSYLFSCPLWFWVDRDLSRLHKPLRQARSGQDELVVFSKIASTWVASPYQWDALNPAGGLDFARQGVKISQLKAHDRLVIDPIFGDKLQSFEDFPCKCRSKNCCGYIIRAESRWRINKKFSMSNKKRLIDNSL